MQIHELCALSMATDRSGKMRKLSRGLLEHEAVHFDHLFRRHGGALSATARAVLAEGTERSWPHRGPCSMPRPLLNATKSGGAQAPNATKAHTSSRGTWTTRRRLRVLLRSCANRNGQGCDAPQQAPSRDGRRGRLLNSRTCSCRHAKRARMLHRRIRSEGQSPTPLADHERSSENEQAPRVWASTWKAGDATRRTAKCHVKQGSARFTEGTH